MSSAPITNPAVTSKDLRLLAPRFALELLDGMNECWLRGYDVVVFEAMRSAARQEWLYAQGRTRPGDRVTNARSALYSWHGYGLAVDIISKSKAWGQPHSWWQGVADILKARNLAWGGDWTSRDLPHFQWGRPMRASPSARARELIAKGGVAAVWKEVGAM